MSAAVQSVAPERLPEHARALLKNGGRFQFVYAWTPDGGETELRYVASAAPRQPFAQWRTAARGQVPSLAPISPLLGWHEREITDLFGFEFEGHPEAKPLVLPAGSPPPFAPGVSPQYPPNGAESLPEIDEPDVQRLPWGPVRAGVVESGEFVFFYAGEHILHYHPLLFFKHRGVEARFEGMSPRTGVVLAERVSGVGSFAHGLAFCHAVEAAAGCKAPQRARLLRVLLAELERIYNHLYYFGHLADTTTLKIGHAEGVLLAERAKQVNGRLTGSRFLRSLLTPGGLRRDLAIPDWLQRELAAISDETARYLDLLQKSKSYLDRIVTTGLLDRQTAFDQGATGPIERASGIDRDLRRDHPYDAYDKLPLNVAGATAGDANARADVRAAELLESFSLVRAVLDRLHDGPIIVDCNPPPESEGLGWAESPRGSLFYAVHVGADGRLARVKIKSPSFSNWRVFPFTVHETNMMDYAINEASFGLTIAGCDR
jgi:Ni,Fe-hydrogenase III large subunit